MYSDWAIRKLEQGLLEKYNLNWSVVFLNEPSTLNDIFYIIDNDIDGPTGRIISMVKLNPYLPMRVKEDELYKKLKELLEPYIFMDL